MIFYWLCASGGLGVYPAKELHNAWECILLHQFHDIIPGSSIREVYEDSEQAYTETETALSKLTADAVNSLTQTSENCFVLCNFGSFSKRELVFLPLAGEGVFSDSSGELPAQKTDGGWLVNVTISALSMKTVSFAPGAFPDQNGAFAPDMDMGILETPLYRIAWDQDGRLISLVDKRNGRQVLAGPCNVLEIYEDKPISFDNWNIDIFHTQKREKVASLGAPRLLENPFALLIPLACDNPPTCRNLTSSENPI